MNGNYFYSLRKRKGKGFTRIYLSVCRCFCVSVRYMAAGGIPLDRGQASILMNLILSSTVALCLTLRKFHVLQCFFHGLQYFARGKESTLECGFFSVFDVI